MRTCEELRRIVAEIEPVLREGAARAETEANVPAHVVDALRDAGLFRMWIPASLGGWEVDPPTAFRVFEELSAIDSAAGWLVQMSAAISGLGVFFGDEAVEELYSGPDHIFADAFSPPGRATPVDGGYEVVAHTPWASNCKNADWFFCTATVTEDGEPKIVDGHPLTKVIAVPTSEIEIVDNWNVTGMRGTGSHDVKISGVFVPEHRAADLVPLDEPANDAWPTSFGNMTVWHIVASVGVPALGIARAALESFVALGRKKTPAYEHDTMSTQALAHYRLGEATAMLGAARAYMHGTITDVWDSASGGQLVTEDQKCRLQSAGTFAARAACDAVELLVPSAGGAAVREGGDINRQLRDLRTIVTHAYIRTDRYRDVGALTMGQPAAWGFLAF